MTIKDINEFVKTELEGLIGNLAGRDTKGIKQEIRFILERAIDGTNLLDFNHHLADNVVKKLYVPNLTPYNYDVPAIMQEIKKYKFANVLASTKALNAQFDMYRYGDRYYIQGLRGMYRLEQGYISPQFFEIFKREFTQGFKAYLRLKGRNKSYHGVEQYKPNEYISNSGVQFSFVLQPNTKEIGVNIRGHNRTVPANELVDDIKTYLKMTKLKFKSMQIKGHGETWISFNYKILDSEMNRPIAPKLPLQDLIDKLREESLAKTEERRALKAKQDALEGEIFELNNDINILAKALVVSEARLNKK
jgi:hypothetical protein